MADELGGGLVEEGAPSYSDIGGEAVEPGEQTGVETFPEPAGGTE